jgi:hypothetical protein
MKVPILTFAEYATVTSDNKLVIAGAIDGITVRLKKGVPKDAPRLVELPLFSSLSP